MLHKVSLPAIRIFEAVARRGSHRAAAAELNLSVALIDKAEWGGTCLHRGCIPTKALLHAAEVADETRHAEKFGVKATLESVDMAAVREYKNGIVAGKHKGLTGLLKMRKVQVIEGEGKLVSQDEIEVDGTRYKGKNIAEVLDMPIEEAEDFFAAVPAIARHMKTLTAVGLGYVRLGQPATTLSGGEAQRVKLAAELQKRSNGRTIYVLDEPTTGLHFDDIRKLLHVLQSLVDKGNTVLTIEHNLDVIKSADHVIDLGPEGGSGGGTIVAAGTPEEVAHVAESHTGRFLAELLA